MIRFYMDLSNKIYTQMTSRCSQHTCNLKDDECMSHKLKPILMVYESL